MSQVDKVEILAGDHPIAPYLARRSGREPAERPGRGTE